MAAAWFNTKLDNGTAAACRDYERPRVNTLPERRRALMRLAVVFVVLAFTAWAVEWIAANSSGFHIKEVDYPSTEAQAYFLPVPAGSLLNASSAGMIPDNITCPCLGQSSFGWCKFIDFYLITCNQETNYQLNVTKISSSNSSSSCTVSPSTITFACHNSSDPLSCSNALDTVYDFTDTKTYIQTSNLASPFHVFQLVATSMQSNIHANNRTILGNLNSNNPRDYNRSMLVLSLVQSMVAQVFDCNTSSTMQQFWDRANLCGWNLYPDVIAQFNGRKFAFGMDINYEAYSTTCKPKKCFIIVKDNFDSRFMNALAKVGGVGSFILLGIQVILWPLVAMICRFPFEHDFQAGAVGEHVNKCCDFF